jgi:hypothetical protein
MSIDARARIPLNEGAIRKALGDSDTPGLVLFTIALYEFGPSVMGDEDEGVEAMDPAEMWAELHSRYNTWVTEEGENKLNAIVTGLTGGSFWYDVDIFMAVATALFDGDLGDMIDTGFENLSATEIMWAVLEMGLAWDSDEEPQFSLDVRQYVNEVLSYEQEDQDQNAVEIEKVYLLMLDQMRELGIPGSFIRVWDEEYAQVVANLEDGRL